ncbi:preprotein translocase subunit SecA [Acinetobacter sp. YH12079]|uniref:preprotein translocase subunit SecA n=1 Tax=unclassified Acinetobacter TaxID=196816 RepID=UPI0035A378D4
MSQNSMPQNKKSKYHHVNPDSWSFKLFLIYDIFMVFIIVFNLFCLCMNFFLMSNLGSWFFNSIHLPDVLTFYREHLHPWVITTEAWFIIFLIVELLVRWAIAIINKHHQRWFFFPFIHWYEILAIVPHLRFLRLFRAGVIAYRLYEMGYQIVPSAWQKKALFYYRVVMEELSDRVVLTVLDGVKHELNTSTTHKDLISNLVQHHREMFTQVLAEILQENLSKELRTERELIAKNVGQIVSQAIEDTPELTQLLRLVPIVGSRIEQQIQSIGQRLGENITQGLISPLAYPNTSTAQKPNLYLDISQRVSRIEIENNAQLDELVRSAVFESLEAIRKQVKVKQWQQIMQEQDQATE